MGVQIVAVEAGTPEEIEPAIIAAVAQRAEALFIHRDPLCDGPPERLPQIVARAGLPAIYLLRAQVEAGGLISYGPDFWRCHVAPRAS